MPNKRSERITELEAVREYLRIVVTRLRRTRALTQKELDDYCTGVENVIAVLTSVWGALQAERRRGPRRRKGGE